MRRFISILVLILAATACSTDQRVVVDGGTAEQSSEEEAQPTEVDADPPVTTTSVAEREDAAKSTPIRLAPEDVLLPEDALDAPWLHQHRTLEKVAYGPGAQQSDCADYWRLEQAGGLGTAQALWWRDGANLLHDVVPFDSAEEAQEVMAAANRVVDECPVISWGEGGDYQLSSAALDIDDVEGVESVAILIDEGDSQQRWTVFSLRENVLSVINVPTWNVDGTPAVTPDEVSFAASLAVDRLAAAGPERERPVPTTTTTVAPVPTTAVPATVPARSASAELPPEIEAEIERLRVEAGDDINKQIANAQSIQNLINDHNEKLPAELVALLLGDSEIDGDWVVWRTDPYYANPTSPGDLEECPELVAFDAIDSVFEVQRDFGVVDVNNAAQMLGRATDASAASAMVSGFVAIEPCLEQSLATEIEEAGVDESIPIGFSVSLETVEVANASAATKLEVEIDGVRSVIVVIAVGDVVSAIALDDSVLQAGGLPLGVAELAAAKIAAVN